MAIFTTFIFWLSGTSFKPFNYKYAFGESVSSVNNYPQMNWQKMYNQYQNNLDNVYNGQAEPWRYAPQTFLGTSPFKHDMSLGGGLEPVIMRVGNVVDVPAAFNPSGRLGLRINQQFQNTTDQWGHAHTLEGTNNFPGVNWPEHFNRFIEHHAQARAQVILFFFKLNKLIN